MLNMASLRTVGGCRPMVGMAVSAAVGWAVRCGIPVGVEVGAAAV